MVSKGIFVYGIPQGKGSGTLPNGDAYEGEVARNAFNGKGKYTYQNGDVLSCGFQDGRPQGAGEYYVATDAATRRGVWHIGLRESILFVRSLNISSFPDGTVESA